MDLLGQLNWLAVIVGAALYFALGELWYAPPVFGRAWERSFGRDPAATLPQMRIVTYSISAVAYLIKAVAVGMLAAATGSDSLEGGVMLGLVVGVTYVLCLTVVNGIFRPYLTRSWVWSAIDGAYHVVGLIIVSVVVSVWP